jgi:hypothetical protein
MNTEELSLSIKEGHIGEALLSYAMIRGATPELIKAGNLTYEVDKTWTITVNGTPNKIAAVPPYSWYIEFNGWPAGILSVITGEGLLCAGAAGNAKELAKALFESITLYLKTNATNKESNPERLGS